LLFFLFALGPMVRTATQSPRFKLTYLFYSAPPAGE
jgi:hypothetical protein